MIIEQRRGKEEYTMEAHKSRLVYSAKGAGSNLTITLPYEVLGRKTAVVQKSNRFFRTGAIYFAIITVVWMIISLVSRTFDITVLFSGLASVALLAAHWLTRVPYEMFHLSDGRQIRLLKDAPSRNQYDGFLTGLFELRDTYLRDTYARVDPTRPLILERTRIDWLKTEGVLDDVAYAAIVDTLEDHR